MSVDVLIVGSGPTGLLLAAQLARHGITPRLIDKNPQPSDKSKALAVFARTLEIFDELGIAQEAIARGRLLYGGNIYSQLDRIAHINLGRIDSFFPFVLCLPQYETECLLGRYVESLGVKIERPVTFTTMEQDTDGVTTILCHPDGQQERCRAAWLIGCDGARSTVRESVGLTYGGVDLNNQFILADARVDWNLLRDEIHLFYSADGVLAGIPLPQENYWRVIADFPPDAEPPEHLALSLFQRLVIERSHLNVSMSDPLWMSRFSIRQRMVGTCRSGRVIVAGDALSSHSPIGGQGMNTGLQDAYNLAWKLALVIRQQGRVELLDSYPAEREPVSESLLNATEWGTRIVTLRNPVLQNIRQSLLGFFTRFDRVQHHLATTLSELNVNYRNSPIVQENSSFPLPAPGNLRNWFDFHRGPQAGDRAPDAMVQVVGGLKRLFHVFCDLKHNLLLFNGKDDYVRLSRIAREIEETFRDRSCRCSFGNHIAVHLVLPTAQIPEAIEWDGSLLLDPQAECHHRYGAEGECLYLIRPDGYIGYRSQPIDPNRLKAYLEKIFV